MEFRSGWFVGHVLRPHRLIKMLAFGVSVIIVYFLSMYGPLKFPAYTLKIQPLDFLNSNDNRIYNFYHDFDHDGFSEQVLLKYGSSIYLAQESGIKIYNSNGGIIDQWNFLEPWVLQKPLFADTDQDGYDEVYIFTMRNDSLFLYGVDPRQKLRFKIYRKFLFHGPRPNPNPKKIWDLYIIQGFSLDGDKDGYPDLYFNVRAGFSLQPRQMFAYSVHKDSLWASPISGALLAEPRVLHIPSTPPKSIIYFYFANSPGNFHKPFPYSDQSAWFMAFTPQLQFLFPPKEFKHFGSNLEVIPVKWDNQYYFLVLRTYIGDLNIKPRLLLYTLSGELVEERVLPAFYNNSRIGWRLFVYQIGKNPYVYTHLGDVYEINRSLAFVHHHKLKLKTPGGYSIQFFTAIDVNQDGIKEILGMTNNLQILYDSHFNEIVRFNLNSIPGNLISINYRGKRPPGFLFKFGHKREAIWYFNPNPYASLATPVRLAVFGVGYFLLYYLFLFIYQGLFYIYLLNTLFRRHPNGVCIVYDNQQVAWMNSNFIRYFGLPGVRRAYGDFREEFVHIPELVQFIQKLFDVNTPLEDDIAIQRDSRKPLRGKIKGLPIRGKTGISMGYLIEYVDRESPEVVERWRIWSSTMKKLAHDIKTPLSTILLNIQTIQYKIKELVPQAYAALEQDLNLIRNEVQRVREITKNFLKFSNIETPNFQRISLRYVLNKTLRHFQKYTEGDLEIRLELDEDVDVIWADPQQLEMVFQILIENAIDAIKGQGIILISAVRAQYPEENFAEYVEIDIADSGSGIPEDIRSKIFEPYFTTKKEGTGLGLAIARKIIEDHGGKIIVTTREGFPTVIKIVLPLQEELENGTDTRH